MNNGHTNLFLGESPLRWQPQAVAGDTVQLFGETFYRINNVDQMPTFFMTLVSGADHWLFIASNGGLTAGRQDANSALFPYETEDKIAAHHAQTGGKTVARVTRDGRTFLWEPFADQTTALYHCRRNLYKNVAGSMLIFEEINHDLQLTWRSAWRTGDRFGFIRTVWLQNDGAPVEVDLLDGLQNVLPYGASVRLQSIFSSLLNAYKRTERHAETGLGIFTLSATLTDQAEPSESLMATAVWQVGLENVTHLLSSEQLDAFRRGQPITAERDVRGKPGAYLVGSRFALAADASQQWSIVADVNLDGAAVVGLTQLLRQPADELNRQLEADIAQTAAVLHGYVAAADGLQATAVATTGAHHFANVMFNVMRGGIFMYGYDVERRDLQAFLQTRNRRVLAKHAVWLEDLPQRLPISDLYARAAANGDPNLIRLCDEYLPLTFSRRHGDPSRPWNQFAINLKHADGAPRLDYQGNWRDIFQNWEPLLLSFPDYIKGVIAKFLNATTADGYNPYRVTRAGIEWEVPEPDDPWSNIGYWSDHQIIYLQKLLEIAAQVQPGALAEWQQQPVFAYADVPYRLKPYTEMLADWYQTIDFDDDHNQAIAAAVDRLGTDGRLLRNDEDDVIHVTMMEKLLVLLLAKLTNLVPAGGIWMNTQRPEWNDANNALVGKGLSVVTAAYLRRFVVGWRRQLAAQSAAEFSVNTAVADLLTAVQRILTAHQDRLTHGFDDGSRRVFMDEMGTAVTAYRAEIYANGVPTAQRRIRQQTVADLLQLAQTYLEHTLRANRREDDLYHAYNILHRHEAGMGVAHLYLMLEGQVAILSSGMLAADEALALLRSLRQSALYRADQHSYMLYPNRDLPGFLQKNKAPAARVADSRLVAALVEAGDKRLLAADVAGDFHFNGRFRNANDVTAVLDTMAQEPALAALVADERQAILDLFEETFNHRAFTGRSGAFFAFEGLGSIYWHMVSKLLLAVQEVYQQALQDGEDTAVVAALADAYYDIRAGIGFNKSPDVYGAFPTDPYSHTPLGNGARQPGMTGQVKEEILTRWGELGVQLRGGALQFAPTLLLAEEFFTASGTFDYFDADGAPQALPLRPGSLAFTYCQTPVVYVMGERAEIEVVEANGRRRLLAGSKLDGDTTRHILDRDGQIHQLRVTIPKEALRRS